jgi:hypothetical protein
MNVAREQRGQVLILLAAWLFFTGGAASALVVYDDSGKDTKKAIKRIIADEDRKDAIMSYIDYWQSGQAMRDKRVDASRDELFKALRRQDVTRAELEPTLKQLDVTFVEMDRDFLDLRFRLQARVTRGEWAEIIAARGG